MEIWATSYNPFIMGGNPHQPVKSDVPVDGPYDLGMGYEGYLATSPDSGAFVVEATSGGIVGRSLETVREDIAQGDPALMVKQVENGRKERDRARTITPEEFWKGFRKK